MFFGQSLVPRYDGFVTFCSWVIFTVFFFNLPFDNNSAAKTDLYNKLFHILSILLNRRYTRVHKTYPK